MNQNLAAFFSMLSHAEGTDRPPAPTDPYRTCYAFHHVIVDLSDHPAVTGEWLGELITVGIYAGERSTAAGRYQINKPTWQNYRSGLSDFSAASQDTVATRLIDRNGALDLVLGGQLEAAIARLHGVWASLPGSISGQPQRTLAELTGIYSTAGGVLA